MLPLLAAGGSAPSCEPIAGWDALLAVPGKRFIVVGETHGTEETPELFGEAACLTGQSRPLVVALEVPDSDQDELDAYLHSDGGEAARVALFGAQLWKMEDGRGSHAMMGLIERLRHLHQAGAVQAVIAFQPAMLPAEGFTPQWYERAMAKTVMRQVPEQGTALVLVGEAHARTSEITFNSQSYLPMAAYFPAQETVTLVASGHGGASWNCQRATVGGTVECRAHDYGRATGVSPDRGLVLGPPGTVLSGVLHVGGPFTASPPHSLPPFQTTLPTTSTSAIATSTGS